MMDGSSSLARTARPCVATFRAVCTTRARRRRRRSPSAGSVLALWHPNGESVEFFGDLDLARETAVGGQVLCEIEHRLLHVFLWRQLGEPCLVDIDVAGRARASTPTIGIDTRHEVLYRPFHDGPALRHLDLVLLAVVLDVPDLRHGRSLDDARVTLCFS